jgi:outer membrane immunogenic protein
MNFRSGILGLTLSSVIALASANAADIYVPGPVGPGGYKDAPWVPTWAGFYVGVDVGGAWAKDHVSPTVADGGTFPRHNTLSTDGVFGGGTLGYNFQRGAFVFGVEGDLGGMNISQKKADPLGGTEIDFLNSGLYGDVTGRLGYSWGPALLYAKGGFAFYDGEAKTTTAIPGFTVGNTSTFTGWTLGGGVEYKINPAWSLKAEYLHFDFGSERATLTSGAGVFGYKNELTVDTAKVGINYYFLPSYVPLK